MPTVSTMPAMPGSVSVALEERQDAEDHADVDRDRDVGEQPEQAVGREHEHDHQDRAGDRGVHAGLDRSPRRGRDRRPAARSTVSLAGSAPARSRIARSLADSTVKLPEICPEPPRIGSRIDRRRDHLVVEHDGERPADVLLRRLRELAGAAGVEAERHDRLAGALVEAGLRVGQVGACDQRLLVDQDRESAGRPRVS